MSFGRVVGSPQCRKPVMESRLDGALALPCSRRDLRDAQVLDDTEDDHDPMLRSKLIEGTAKSVAFSGAREGVGSEAISRLDPRDPRSPTSPQPRAAFVHEDAIEPRLEPVRIAQVVPVQPGPDGGIVDGVLGVDGITKHQCREPVGPLESTLGELLECLAASSGGTGGAWVHVRRSP